MGVGAIPGRSEGGEHKQHRPTCSSWPSSAASLLHSQRLWQGIVGVLTPTSPAVAGGAGRERGVGGGRGCLSERRPPLLLQAPGKGGTAARCPLVATAGTARQEEAEGPSV